MHDAAESPRLRVGRRTGPTGGVRFLAQAAVGSDWRTLASCDTEAQAREALDERFGAQDTVPLEDTTSWGLR